MSKSRPTFDLLYSKHNTLVTFGFSGRTYCIGQVQVEEFSPLKHTEVGLTS